MKKNVFSKILLSIVFVLFFIVSSIGVFDIGYSASVNTGVPGISANSSGDATWEFNSTSGLITGSVAASSSSGCTGTTYTEHSGKLTITNTSGSIGAFSFDYTVVLSGGTITINGTGVTAGSTFSKTLEDNESFDISLTSNKTNTTATTIELKNLKFTAEQNVTITFSVSNNGTYKVGNELISSETQKTFKTTDDVVLTATAGNNYKFYRWVNYTSNETISTSNPLTHKFSESIVCGCEFVPTSKAIFGVEGYTTIDLNDAIQYSQTNNKTKIHLIGNGGTLDPGTYNLPSGKTLLIPFDSALTVYTDKPEVVYGSHANPSAFSTLTMVDGCIINVLSGATLSVPSKICATGTGTGSWNGTPTGKYGHIHMNSGSKIVVQSGGTLSCFGYISGDGEVEANNNSTIWECFQIRCWRGGTAVSGMAGNSQGVFPLNQYYVQNIEANLKMNYGAIEKVYTAVNMNSKAFPASANFLGSGGLFIVEQGSYLIKKYDGATDRLILEVNGNSSLSAFSLKINDLPLVGTLDLQTSDYVLPITSNITINVKSGIVTIDKNQRLALLPGAELNIDEGTTVKFGNNIYIYDHDNWGAYAAAGVNLVPVGYSTVNGTTAKRSNVSLVDAQIDVNGNIEPLSDGTGSIYTTSGHAAIISSNGSGKFTNKSGSETKTYQATQSGSSMTYVDIAIDIAYLKNGDGTFVPSTAYLIKYNKIQDCWGGTNVSSYYIIFTNGSESTTTEFEHVSDGSSLDTFTFPTLGTGANQINWQNTPYVSRWVSVINEEISFEPGESTNSDLRALIGVSGDSTSVTFRAVLYSGWQQSNSQWSYFTDSGKLKGIHYLKGYLNENKNIYNNYCFDENGYLMNSNEQIFKYDNSIFENGDNNYYYVLSDGSIAKNKGMYRDGINEYNYYFFNSNYAFRNGTIYLSENDLQIDQNNFYLCPGYYTFEDSKIKVYQQMIYTGANQNLAHKPIVSNDNEFCIIDGVKAPYGLFSYDGHNFYALDDGRIAKNKTVYIVKNYNSILLENNINVYYFDSNGYMCDSLMNPITVS